MRRRKRKMWEIDIGVQRHKKCGNVYRFNKFNSIDIMQTKAENILNPLRYYLSKEAKKRLKWMYIIYYECDGNISQAANKIGISRQWLSAIHNKWKKLNKDPRSLEPTSKAPKNTNNRQRINQETENNIIEARNKYHWGKDKLETVLDRDYQIKVGASTINRYLAKYGLLNVRISNKNKRAYQNKINNNGRINKQKLRPPTKIKDYKPGALVEKDMKFILKMGQFTNPDKFRAKENYWYQHTTIDSFTRIRTIGLAEDSNSKTAVMVQEETEDRLPFAIACENTDNGGENGKDFSEHLEKNNIVHFYSRAGTPTDNPRVERSHLTDEVEFYQHGNICKTFAEQKQKILNWEYIYNYIRPHQALGNLTPMAFYELWKKDSDKAYEITEKWQKYLNKQRRRLNNARRIKKKEQINKLMQQIDKKLANNYN